MQKPDIKQANGDEVTRTIRYNLRRDVILTRIMFFALGIGAAVFIFWPW